MEEKARLEKRQFVRMPSSLPVTYRFLSCVPEFQDDHIRKGRTDNVGGGGLMLTGQVPSVDWITELLMESVLIALTVELPDGRDVQAIAKVAWLEAVDQNTEECQLGLTYKEITTEDRDKILHLVIKAHAPAPPVRRE